MANTKNKGHNKYRKPKTCNIFLCCFGSPSTENKASNESTVKESDPIPKEKRTSWFSWKMIRIKKNSASKTVPLEASVPSVKVHYSKSKSKSTLHNKSQAPVIDPPQPTRPPLVLPVTPYYTPTQTRHGLQGGNNVEEMHQHASPKQAKRHVRQLQNQTTQMKKKIVRRSYGPMAGMSVVVVTLVILIFWGRLCAILCTSVWLYFIPRFRMSAFENDKSNFNKKSNEMDLDSEMYKKKVILEGLLDRNHKGAI